jgi:hypothetical protein
MTNLPPALDYLPKKLRTKPLYVRIATLMDYIRQTHYEDLIKHPSGKWDPDSPNYNADKVIDELNGSSYLKYLQDGESKVILSRLLSGLYKMKGSKRALNMIMSLVGVKGTVIDYFKLERERALKTEQSKVWDAGPEGDLLPCEVLVTIDIDIQQRFSTTQETLLRDLVESYLWSCTSLAAFLVIRYYSDQTMPDLIETDVSNELGVLIYSPLSPNYANYGGTSHLYTISGTLHSGSSSGAGIPDMYDHVTTYIET